MTPEHPQPASATSDDHAVAFVIPCYNHGRFIADATRSALEQTHPRTRVVIVNDGSDDAETPDQCDRAARLDPDRVRVLHQPNRGLPAARNAGAAHAARDFPETDHLVFLDADDTVAPTFVARLLETLASAPEDVSHAYCQEVLTELGQDTLWRVPEWDPELLLITNLHPVTCLVRREAFERVAGFDETMTDGYEDWELWIRLAEAGRRGVRCPEPLFFWRRHSRETMIDGSVPRHAALYRSIIDRHRDLYETRAMSLGVRMNAMLRAFDCNWLDEDHVPIPLRYLRESTERWHEARPRLSSLEASLSELERERDRCLARAKAAERDRRELESTLAVRTHRALHAVVGKLPAPLARAARGAMRTLAALGAKPR